MNRAERAEFEEWEQVKTLALEAIPPESRPTFNLTGITQQAIDAKALESYPQGVASNLRETWPINLTGIYPTEFKVLILPDPVEEKKGSIIMPEMTKAAEMYATITGRIIAVSHLAFTYATAEEWGDAKPKPGDRVIFAKYAGVRHKAKDGQEYLLVNDKDVVAVVE